MITLMAAANVMAQRHEPPAVLAAEQLFPACEGSDIRAWNNCFADSVDIQDYKYTGELQKGMPAGLGVLWPKGGGKYVGEFANGDYNGTGVFVYKNGTKYVGTFRNDARDGAGILYAADGSIQLAGLWERGQFQGRLNIQASALPRDQDEHFERFIAIYKAAIENKKKKAEQLTSVGKSGGERYCFGSASKYVLKSCDIKDIRADGYIGNIVIHEFVPGGQIKRSIYLNERVKARFPGTMNDMTAVERFSRNGGKFTQTYGAGCEISGEISETDDEITINQQEISGPGCTDSQKRLFNLAKGAATHRKIYY
jgi:hypothetical protein